MTNPNVQMNVASRIKAFVALPKGWHFGDGIGATATAVKTALDINLLLSCGGAKNIEAFPLIGGGVLVSGYHDHDTLEIRCMNDGGIELTHEIVDKEHCCRDGLSLFEVKKYIGDMKWSLSNSYVRYTQSTSAKKKNDFKVTLSSHHQAGKEFQFLRLTVPLTEANVSAGILIATTGILFLSHVSFGESVQVRFPRTATSQMSLLPQATHATGISTTLKTAVAGA